MSTSEVKQMLTQTSKIPNGTHFSGVGMNHSINGRPSMCFVGQKPPTISGTATHRDIFHADVAGTSINYLENATSNMSLSEQYCYNSTIFGASSPFGPDKCRHSNQDQPEQAHMGFPDRQLHRSIPGFSQVSKSPIEEVYPGTMFPSHDQLSFARGYALRRGDGSYTRLIPADSIQKWIDIPKYEKPEGLIIIPTVGAVPEEASLGTVRSGSDLDPSPPSAKSVSGWNQCRMRTQYFKNHDRDAQHVIDDYLLSPQINELMHLGLQTTQYRSRKKKVYCDKWVHEGVCAFTQQGCKYKHEMPMDRATQLELGLNNGLPFWWRRQQSAKFKSNFNDSRPESSRATGPWRRTADIPSRIKKPPISDELSYGGEERSFGPVGTPVPQMPLWKNRDLLRNHNEMF
ncbi:hypothetical protein F5884DRAFT_766477 [Xylogone sp. PMI_703]|nr:hypothetical protein F5884DRAFT_766477 [Xylogone sp. PMI_703]